MTQIAINRAPVLALWGAVVAERLGHPPDTALTLGEVIAGKTAQSKGQRLGIKKPRVGGEAKQAAAGKMRFIEFMGRHVTMTETANGLRAMEDGMPIAPAAVEAYLSGKFGADLAAARTAMEKLALAHSPAQLARSAFALYTKFRPSVPSGTQGWGKDGVLDLATIENLAAAKKG